MKKLILLLSAIMLFLMTACSRAEQPETEQPETEQTVAEQPETEEPEEESMATEEPVEEEPGAEEPAEEEPAEEEPAAGESAYDIYMKAAEALREVDSLRMNMTMEMGMGDDETETFSFSAYTEQVFISETEIDMKMDMTIELMGESMNTLMYYKDGMAYMEMYDMKVKQPMDVDEAMQQGNVETIDFNEDVILSQSMNEVSGNKEITFVLDGVALSDELLKQMNGVDSQTAGAGSVTFDDMEMEVVIDSSGNIKSYSISCPYHTSAPGYVVSGNMNVSMEVLQIGGVTIAYPADLDSYLGMEEVQ